MLRKISQDQLGSLGKLDGKIEKGAFNALEKDVTLNAMN